MSGYDNLISIKVKRGTGKAIIATARKLLNKIFYTLKNGWIFDDFSRAVYFCPAGYPTIGYGLVVKDDEDFSAGIDEAQLEELLRQDAQIAERAVLRLINVPLTDGQFDALVSFTYNLGGGAFQRSTLRRKISTGMQGGFNLTRQCMRTAQAEVKAMSGDRVHTDGGIAYQSKPVCMKCFCQRCNERIREKRACEFHCAKARRSLYTQCRCGQNPAWMSKGPSCAAWLKTGCRQQR